MNETELKQARKQYRTAIKEKKKIDEIKKEIEELKKSKEVLKYIELLKYEKETINSDEEIIKLSFEPIGFHTKESNNIYVFMGSYKKNFGVAPDRLLSIKNESCIDYNIYWNLETESPVKVIKEKINKFEDNHIIINNNISELSPKFIDYFNNFKKIQNTYYKTLTYTTIDKAIKKLKKTYK